jgi:hypothetical protein
MASVERVVVGPSGPLVPEAAGRSPDEDGRVENVIEPEGEKGDGRDIPAPLLGPACRATVDFAASA